MNKARKNGFTLIELLVVITIISILATMLLPSLKNALERARTVSCVSTQKGLGTAILMYTNDYGERFPFAWSPTFWWEKNHPITQDYLDGDTSYIMCPSAPNSKYGDSWRTYYNNYGINPIIMTAVVTDNWESAKTTTVKRPSEVAVFVDAPYVSEGSGAWFRLSVEERPRAPGDENPNLAEVPIIQQNAKLDSCNTTGDGWEALNTIRFRHNGVNNFTNVFHVDGHVQSYKYGEFKRKNLARTY